MLTNSSLLNVTFPQLYNGTNLTVDGEEDYSSGGGGEVPGWPSYLAVYVTILNLALFFIGTMGNTLVIVVVVSSKDMRTPMNWYLVNLSAADLMVLLVCQPAALTEFFARDRWLLGAVLCEYMVYVLFS
jgi:hypothetical protein